MKQASIIFAILLGFIGYGLSTQSADAPLGRSVFVYKLDGTKHCERHAGESVDAMSLKLTDVGIEVLSYRKGYDGREGIAQCGAPTGQINIYEIFASDLRSALNLGFKKLPQNWNIDNLK